MLKKKVMRWKLKKLLLESGKIPPDRISNLINHIIKHYEIKVSVEELAEEIIKSATGWRGFLARRLKCY